MVGLFIPLFGEIGAVGSVLGFEYLYLQRICCNLSIGLAVFADINSHKDCKQHGTCAGLVLTGDIIAGAVRYAPQAYRR